MPFALAPPAIDSHPGERDSVLYIVVVAEQACMQAALGAALYSSAGVVGERRAIGHARDEWPFRFDRAIASLRLSPSGSTAMHAVFRETSYPSSVPIQETAEFREFQRLHAGRPGYCGTVVAAVGDGRHLTMTLWRSAEDMQAAREALEPVIGALIAPRMTAPSVLLGTGHVVAMDIAGLGPD
jgi:hypothetical protein